MEVISVIYKAIAIYYNVSDIDYFYNKNVNVQFHFINKTKL